MRPVFTVHAGEMLAGDYIQRAFPHVNVWVPAKDTGVDLLVTDRGNRAAVSLQVKFSRDFAPTHLSPQLQQAVRFVGWWTLDIGKLASSPAEYWVFVLVGFGRHATDFVVIPTDELSRRLRAIHPAAKRMQSYLWLTNEGRCWEARGLRKADQRLIAAGEFIDVDRDFSAFLNNWTPLEALNR